MSITIWNAVTPLGIPLHHCIYSTYIVGELYHVQAHQTACMFVAVLGLGKQT